MMDREMEGTHQRHVQVAQRHFSATLCAQMGAAGKGTADYRNNK